MEKKAVFNFTETQKKLLLKAFLEFLNKEDLYDSFITNMNSDANLGVASGNKYKNVDETFIELAIHNADERWMTEVGFLIPPLVSCGFVWHRTSQGHDFWIDVEDRFQDYVKVNYKELAI